MIESICIVIAIACLFVLWYLAWQSTGNERDREKFVDLYHENKLLREDKDRLGKQMHDCMLEVQSKEDEIKRRSERIDALKDEQALIAHYCGATIDGPIDDISNIPNIVRDMRQGIADRDAEITRLRNAMSESLDKLYYDEPLSEVTVFMRDSLKGDDDE